MASFLSKSTLPPFPKVSPFYPSAEEFLSRWPYAWLEALAPSSATSFGVRSLEASFPPDFVSGLLLRGLPHLAPTTSGSRDRSPGAFLGVST